MNSNMVKPEKFGHPHLVCQFTIPLTSLYSGPIKIMITNIRKIENIPSEYFMKILKKSNNFCTKFKLRIYQDYFYISCNPSLPR